MSTEGLLLLVAAFLSAAVGLAHSFLGERYILIPLFRRNNLPKLFGATTFTTRTLRFAWHLTTIAWWGAAALFLAMAQAQLTTNVALQILGATFLLTAVVTLAISRGRHLAWPVFLAIAAISFYCANG